MRALISTMPNDIHAMVVTAGLEQSGVEVVSLHHADFPLQQQASFLCNRHESRVEWSGADLSSFDPDDFDIVWNRRHAKPLPHPDVSAEDLVFATGQVHEFSTALWWLCGPDAFWVNPEPAAQHANSKVVQLHLARKLGLLVPDTLVSNDPTQIRDFVAARRGNCIYKPLFLRGWREDDGIYLLYTAGVDAEQLPGDAMLRASPGIFQERVAKAYEVRASMFGAQCCAVRIDSQGTATGRIDWRLAQGQEDLPAMPITVPEPVQASCRRLMAAFGIVYGSFDFIVTPQGEWVFVEVNQTGQFLFLEDWCPQIPVVDIFCRFLQSRDPDFRYVAGRSVLRLGELENSVRVQTLRDSDRRHHLDPYPEPVAEHAKPARAGVR